MDCSEHLDLHFQNHGEYYFMFIVFIQTFYFSFYNIMVASEKEFTVQDYQYYKFGSLSLLLGAMIYFLLFASLKTSPVDLFAFIILATICNAFMFFRDIMFLLYPEFFIKQNLDIDPENKSQWGKLTFADILIVFFAQILYFKLARPTLEGLYKKAFVKVGSRRPVWSK